MEEEQTKPASEKPTSSKKLSKQTFFVILAIIIAVIIGAVAFFLSSQKRETSPISNTILPAVGELTPSPRVKEEVGETTSPSPSPKPDTTPSPSPSPTPTPSLKTKTISSTASLDGFRSSNGGGNASVDIRAGRNVNLVTRGFVSFDLSSLPAGAKIQKATLRLYQYQIIGNPYGVGGSLKVDHLNFGNSLGNEDYGSASISSSFTTLTSNATVEWKDADVTDRVKNDLSNNRTRSQYRIHFQVENIGGNVTGDFAYFESAENTGGTGNTPQLVIEYTQT